MVWYCQLKPILTRLDARPRKKTPEYSGFPSYGSRVLPQMSLKLTNPPPRQLVIGGTTNWPIRRERSAPERGTYFSTPTFRFEKRAT